VGADTPILAAQGQALDNLNLMQLLHGWLQDLDSALVRMPTSIQLAALVLPIAMGAYSRQFFALVGAIFFAAGAILILLEPEFIRTIAVVGAYLGSIILAGVGISAQRKYRSVRAELATLRSDINHLLVAESRRFMVELNSGAKIAPSVATPCVDHAIANSAPPNLEESVDSESFRRTAEIGKPIH